MPTQNDHLTPADRLEKGNPPISPSSSPPLSPKVKTKRRTLITSASLAIMASIIVASFVSSEKETPPDSTRELNSIDDKLADDFTESSVDHMDEISYGVKNAGTTENLVGKQFSGDEFSNENKFELVLQGELQLVSLRYIPESFSYSSDDTYYGVEVEFCKLDYNLHNEDPSEAPTMLHLYELSDHCAENSYKFDLSSLAATARDYDSQSGSTTHSMKPSGFMFGEGRSGSTVISNAITVAHPQSTRVVVENPAISYLLNACNDLRIKHAISDCNPLAQKLALLDIMYLVGRTNDSFEANMYIKLSPEDNEYMAVLLDSFPDAKWTFTYRNPDVVLSKNLQKYRDSICRKAKVAPSNAAMEHAQMIGADDFTALTMAEACSAHMVAMRNIAMKESKSRSTGRLIDYDSELKTGTLLIDEILPNVFGIDTADMVTRSRVSDQIGKKSGRTGGNGTWRGYDPDEDESNISMEVKHANNKFFGNRRYL